MLTQLFKSNRPAVLLLAPLLVLGLFLADLWAPLAAPGGPVMPLYGWLLGVLGTAPMAPGILALLLITSISVQISLLADRAEILGRTLHLPALLFPLLLAALSTQEAFGPALVGMPLVIAAMRSAWSVANPGSVLGNLFNAGLLMGLAAAFHLPYAFLLVAIWIAVSLIRPFQWREYVVPTLAMATVFYLTWAMLKLQGATPWHPLYTLLGGPQPAGGGGSQQVLTLLLVGMLSLAALPLYLSTFQRGIMRQKNLRASFMGFAAVIAVLVGAAYLMRGHIPAELPAVPLSVFCSFALMGTRRAWLGEVAVLALLLLAIWAKWG